MTEYYINVRSRGDVMHHSSKEEALQDLEDCAFDYIHTVHVEGEDSEVIDLALQLREYLEDQKEWNDHEKYEFEANFGLT